ncbi:hypothetical protein [Candidatus Poriferisodalis sp.]|uniref:hypothetical protein n=1 Tax=Candidatus Poriferisodalis sp. TaxID=3101277 RepID=UPI003B01E36F
MPLSLLLWLFALWANGVSLEPSQPTTTAPNSAVDVAIELLATELKAHRLDVILHSAEKVAWSDASLGCQQPGYAYAQVQTPGWRLSFTVHGAEHAVHTDDAGRSAVRPTGCL